MTFIAGRRRKFTLETPVETPDGAGGVTRTWSTLAFVWGELKAVPAASDQIVSGRPELATPFKLTIRWRDDLDGTMRFRLGARIFAVRGIADPDGRRRTLVCTLEEVTP